MADGGFKYIGGGFATGTSSTPSITHGISIQSGDLIVAYINSNIINAISPNNGEGSGWVEEIDQLPDSAVTCEHALYWKIAGGSEPATYTWTAGNAEWQVLLKVFRTRPGATVSVVVPATSDYVNNFTANLEITSGSGNTFPTGSLSIIAGGKDNREASGSWTSVDQGYTNLIGSVTTQMSAMAHQIFNTTTLIAGSTTITHDTLNTDFSYSVHIAFISTYNYPDGIFTVGDTTVGVGEFPCNSNRAIVSKFRSNHEGRAIRAYCYAGPTSAAGTNAKAIIYTAVNNQPGVRVGVSSGGALPAGGGLVDLGIIDCKLYAGTDYFIGIVTNDFNGKLSEDTTGGPFVSRMANGNLSYASPEANFPTTLTEYTDVQFNVWVDVRVDEPASKFAIGRPPKRWTKQPPSGTQIDWSNPLTNGLRMCIDFSTAPQQPRELTTGLVLPTATAPAQYVTNKGVAYAQNSQLTVLTGLPPLRNSYRFSGLVVAIYDTGVSQTDEVWHYVETSSVKGPAMVIERWDSSSLVGRFIQNWAGAGASATGLRPRGGPTAPFVLSGSNGDDNGMRLWFEGSNVGSAAVGTSDNAGTGSAQISLDIGGSSKGLLLALMWDRELAPGEHVALHENPWQIFKPRKPLLIKKPNRRLVVR